MTPEKLKQRRLEREALRTERLLEQWWEKHGGNAVLLRNHRELIGKIVVESEDTQTTTHIDWPACGAITAIVFLVLVMIWRHF